MLSRIACRFPDVCLFRHGSLGNDIVVEKKHAFLKVGAVTSAVKTRAYFMASIKIETEGARWLLWPGSEFIQNVQLLSNSKTTSCAMQICVQLYVEFPSVIPSNQGEIPPHGHVLGRGGGGGWGGVGNSKARSTWPRFKEKTPFNTQGCT